VLGTGSYGAVYEVKLHHTPPFGVPSTVALKRVSLKDPAAYDKFYAQIDFLTALERYSHGRR